MWLNDAKFLLIPLIASGLVQYLFKMEYTRGLMLQPPSYIFGIIWPILYILYGLYMQRIQTMSKTEPYHVWIFWMWSIHLLINVSWSPLVFTYKQYTYGVYLIVMLIGSLIALMACTKNAATKLLLVPYITWLLLALQLNIELVRNQL